MKVLFTGSRRKLFKDESSLFGMEDGTFLQSDQTLAAVYRACMDLGHEVEGPRMVGYMEDLRKYDAIVAEASVSDTHGQEGLVNLLWAMHFTRKVALVVGHWDVKSIYGSYATLARKPGKMFGGFIRYYDSERYARDLGTDWATDTLGEIANGTVPSMVNAYQWGDHSILAPKSLPGGFRYFMDPTAYVVTPAFGARFSMKERRWVTGTYEPFADKQFESTGHLWPSIVYGCEANGHQRLTPTALYAELLPAWGSMVHKYHHDGSGYYRSRYQQLLACGCVAAVLGPKDRESMGEPYRKSVVQVESLSDAELRELFEGQREWFYENAWTGGTFLGEVDRMLKEVSSGTSMAAGVLHQPGQEARP